MTEFFCWNGWNGVSAVFTTLGSSRVVATLIVYIRLLKEAQQTRLDDKRPLLCLRFREVRSDVAGDTISNRIVNAGAESAKGILGTPYLIQGLGTSWAAGHFGT